MQPVKRAKAANGARRRVRAVREFFQCASAAFAIYGCGGEPATQSENAPVVEPAAALPQTDIYLAPLTLNESGASLGSPQAAITNPGYDNQPSFIPGEEAFLFASEGPSGKTDIWRYDIVQKTKTQINDSPAKSEYSPRIKPGGAFISYIQENEVGDYTEVHQMNLEGADARTVIDFAPLGYYAWLDGGAALGVFFRSEPPRLHKADLDGGDKMIFENIGRTLQADPRGRNLYFTHANDNGAHTMMRYDAQSQAVSQVVDMIGESQDFHIVFDADGRALAALAAQETFIYFISLSDTDAGWMPVADFSSGGFGAITRLAISDNRRWLAFVAEAPAQ